MNYINEATENLNKDCRTKKVKNFLFQAELTQELRITYIAQELDLLIKVNCQNLQK